MSDEALRELERRYRSTGDPADEVAWLAARVRAGQLGTKLLEAAAKLGHAAAAEVSGLRPLNVPEEHLLTDLEELAVSDQPWWEWDLLDWSALRRRLRGSPIARPHLGHWVRECIDGVRVHRASDVELFLLRAASGLADPARPSDARHLLEVIEALEARSPRERLLSDAPRVATTGVSPHVASLSAAASQAEDLVRDIKLRLKDGDRPAALDAATELDGVRRAMCDSVHHLGSVESLEVAQRSIRGVIVPLLLR